MKLTAGKIGALVFTALATAAFVWMAKRPAVDGTAMSLGMPTQVQTQADPVPVEATPEKAVVESDAAVTEEKTIEEPVVKESKEEEVSAPKTEEVAPEVEVEKTPSEEVSPEPTVPESIPTTSE